MNRAGRIFFSVWSLFLAIAAPAQSFKERIRQADLMHSKYDFDGAAAIYEDLLKSVNDSTLRAMVGERILMSGNGRNMLLFATQPKVVTSRTVPADEFFLYYGHLADNSWIKTPNAFSDGGHQWDRATYVPSGSRRVVFSAPDGDGMMKLHMSELGEDNLWSEPQVIEACASSGDEVLPLLSASGKELYFSSDALAGMGGYDLYVSRWNERRKSWDAPENLGFPYSSTGDDFLFSNTPDGEFTILASNRRCAPDSMTIYVLKFENSPISRPVSDPAEAAQIAALKPMVREAVAETAPAVEQTDGNAYERAFGRLSVLKEEMDGLVARRNEATDEKSIRAIDGEIMKLQEHISALTDTLCAIELDLIAAGKSVRRVADAEPVAEKSDAAPAEYAFTRRSFGNPGTISVRKPVEETDDEYAFRIEKEAIVKKSLPDGLIYQIQITVVSQRMPVKKLNGLSPAFELKQPTGKYLYTIGAFKTYKEASEALPTVKKKGFPSAYIVAYRNGKSIAVSKAKALE